MRRPASWVILVLVLLLGLPMAGVTLLPDAAAKKKRVTAEAAPNLITTVTKTGTIDVDDSLFTIKPTCPTSELQVVGAGFSGVKDPLYFGAVTVPKNLRGYAYIWVSNVGRGGTFAGHSQCLMRPSWPVLTAVALDPEVKLGEVGVATAYCPRGSTLLGGWTDVEFGTGPGLFITESHPITTLTRHGWTSRVYYKSGEGLKRLLASRVACLNTPLGKVQEVSATSLSVAPGTRRSAWATCPTGMEVASGGFRVPTAGMLVVEGSRPVAASPREQWSESVYNRGTQSAKFTVYAVCVGWA